MPPINEDANPGAPTEPSFRALQAKLENSVTEGLQYYGELPLGGQRWRHWKGDLIVVMTYCFHSETKEVMIIYAHLGLIWTRPWAMWNDTEPKMHGKRRFERVS
jgi:hypothetical protein